MSSDKSKKISKQISDIDKKIQASKQEIKKLKARKIDAQIKLSQFNQSANKLVKNQGTYLDSGVSKSLNSTIESAKKTGGVSKGKHHRHNKKVKISSKPGKMAGAVRVIKNNGIYTTIKSTAKAALTTKKIGSQILKGTIKGFPLIGAAIDVGLYRLLQEDDNDQIANEVLLVNGGNKELIDNYYSYTGGTIRLLESTIGAPFLIPAKAIQATSANDALQAYLSGDEFYHYHHGLSFSVSTEDKKKQLGTTFNKSLNESSKNIIQLKIVNSVLPNLKKQNDVLTNMLSNLNEYGELKINGVDILKSYINKNNANIINLIVSLFFENAYLTTRFLPQLKYLKLDIKQVEITNEIKKTIQQITDNIVSYIGIEFFNIYRKNKISEEIQKITTSNINRDNNEIFGIYDRDSKPDKNYSLIDAIVDGSSNAQRTSAEIKRNKKAAENANKNAVYLQEYIETNKHIHNDYLVILDKLNNSMQYDSSKRFLPDLLLTLICTNQSFIKDNIRYKIHYFLLGFLYNSLFNICGYLYKASFSKVLVRESANETESNLFKICKAIYIFGLDTIIKYIYILLLQKNNVESFSKLSVVHDKQKDIYMVKNDNAVTNDTFLNNNFKNTKLDISSLNFLQQISSNKEFNDINNIHSQYQPQLVNNKFITYKNIEEQMKSIDKYTNAQTIPDIYDYFYYIKDLIPYLNTTKNRFKNDNIKSVEILSYKESIITNTIIKRTYKDTYLNVIGNNQDEAVKQYLSVLDDPNYFEEITKYLKEEDIKKTVNDLFNNVKKNNIQNSEKIAERN